MITPHEIQDQKHFEEIKNSMAINGWQGMPLVKWGDDCLMTGSHRYPAAKSLDWTDNEIPMVDLEDVFAESGLDFADLHDAFGAPTWDEIWGSGLLCELPNGIKEKYGIQF